MRFKEALGIHPLASAAGSDEVATADDFGDADLAIFERGAFALHDHVEDAVGHAFRRAGANRLAAIGDPAPVVPAAVRGIGTGDVPAPGPPVDFERAEHLVFMAV